MLLTGFVLVIRGQSLLDTVRTFVVNIDTVRRGGYLRNELGGSRGERCRPLNARAPNLANFWRYHALRRRSTAPPPIASKPKHAASAGNPIGTPRADLVRGAAAEDAAISAGAAASATTSTLTAALDNTSGVGSLAASRTTSGGADKATGSLASDWAMTWAGASTTACAATSTAPPTATGCAIDHGCYAMVDIPDPKLGPRKIDVETMYNVDRFRPKYENKIGLPIFLTKAR